MTKTTKFLTLREAAEFLRVHPKTLYGWLRAPDGPRAYKYGRKYTFDLDDLLAWASKHRDSNGGPITRRKRATKPYQF